MIRIELSAHDLEQAYCTACLERDITARLHRADATLSPNLCQQCGTKFGMQIIYHDTLAAYPLQPTEVAYRSHADPPNADWVWMPCTYCNPTDIIPDNFSIIGASTDEHHSTD